jgi:hypothetical protein
MLPSYYRTEFSITSDLVVIGDSARVIPAAVRGCLRFPENDYGELQDSTERRPCARSSGSEEIEDPLDGGDCVTLHEDSQLKVLTADPGLGDVRATDVRGGGVRGEHLEVRPGSTVLEGGNREASNVPFGPDDSL